MLQIQLTFLYALVHENILKKIFEMDFAQRNPRNIFERIAPPKLILSTSDNTISVTLSRLYKFV